MKINSIILLSLLCLNAFISCTQNDSSQKNSKKEKSTEVQKKIKSEPHQYGGWYCPDNLGGFPAVDINDWDKVPVVNGRMATKEESSNGTALIDVDLEKYPFARPLDMKMPKLARYYCHSSKKEELVIIIQALNISNDSIVGFRYLNGGNGSSRLNEVKILSQEAIDQLAPSRFVTINITMDAPSKKVWPVLTSPKYYNQLQAVFDADYSIEIDLFNQPKVNYKYENAGNFKSEYAGELYGNMYIQIDTELADYQYVQKFFLSENEETKKSELTIVCGPYGADFKEQKKTLNAWAEKVKELSEK
jgi:hypothetical protein